MLAMRRVRSAFFVMAACVLPIAGVELCAAQQQPVELATNSSSPTTNPTTNPTTTGTGASLRVSLRLEDDSRFLGAAEVKLMPSEGYEVVGTPAETEGETLFTGLAAGKYTVEASAPGYLSVRMGTTIEAGRRERIFYLVMKPRPMAKSVEKPKEATPAAAEIPAGANALLAGPGAAASGEINYWTDHGLEMNVPTVEPSVECPTPRVLKGVGERMKEFVGNLEKFAATEEVEHESRDVGKNPGPVEKRRFPYVVTISRNKLGTFLLDEYRGGSLAPTNFPSNIATNGLPAVDLIFHPVMAEDFQFACEGLGQAEGKAAWQLHFAQRTDRLVRIRAYRVGERTYPVYLEGRAWLDPGNYQVVRLESELQKPVPEIALTREHVVIKYAPVQFRTAKSELWLPQEAELYVERNGHRYYRRHRFTEFKVFSVETAQNIQAPKGSYSFINSSDREVAGVLTVTPREGANWEAVSVSIVVPARGRVFKVVGAGKDVNLPASAVASATFVHEGKAEAMKVEADLANETTLDVVPETVAEKRE